MLKLLCLVSKEAVHFHFFLPILFLVFYFFVNKVKVIIMDRYFYCFCELKDLILERFNINVFIKVEV